MNTLVLRSCALAIALLAVPGMAGAATYVVNTTNVDLPDTNTALAGCDANPVLIGDQCTLRAAIMQANASTGPHTIVLPLNATITLNLMGFGGAESGDLDILQPMTITGAPFGFPADFGQLPRVQAAFSERLFDIGQDVAVTFRGLQLTDGNPTGAAGTNGGALRITADGATVVVDRVRLAENIAATGGAISNSGTLLVDASELRANVATAGAAAIQTNGTGSTTLRGSSIRDIRNEGVTREALRVVPGGVLVVENSYIDGASQLAMPPPTSGIRADRPALLAVRNSTLVDFDRHALDLVLDGASQVRVYNSILSGSDLADCTATTIAGPPPDVVFDYNLVQTSACAAVGGGNWIGLSPRLGSIELGANRFFVTRRPLFGSVAIDGGAPVDVPGNDPLRACLASDINATPRPLDGNADGTPRCDMGAVEAMVLTSSTYVVNTYDVDLPDGNPGDNICDGNPLASGAQCTLRAAVMEANAKPGPDRIIFGGGAQNRLFALSRAGAGGADQGDLDITEQLVIELGDDPAAAGRVAVSAVPGDRVFDVLLPAGQTFALRDIDIRNGEAVTGGGARIDASLAQIERVSFFTNQATGSGGALSLAGGFMAIRDSHFASNSSGTRGGAVVSTAATTVIERSSFLNNIVFVDAEQPAIQVTNGLGLQVRSTTVHGNDGGIHADATPSIDIRASTITGNAGHGLRVTTGAVPASVVVRSTVFAGNTEAHCEFIGGFGGNLMASNHLDTPSAQCAPAGSNSQVGDPLLTPQPRRDPEGRTWFRAPLRGSPLIDAISGNAGVLCPSLDQRGRPRPTDSDGDGVAECEIGAVELSAEEAAPREFVVTVASDEIDENPGDGLCRNSPAGNLCSLRAAVMEANALPGPDLITFAPGLGTLTLTRPPGAANDASEGDLDVRGPTTIRGVLANPAARPLIDADHGDRIFELDDLAPGPTPFVIEGLRLTGGSTAGAGGAIRVTASTDVTLRQLEMFGNAADAGGGGLDVFASTVVLEDSDVRGNSTTGDGAAIRSDGDLSIRRSSIRANSDLDPPAEREAVYLHGNGVLQVENVTFSGNIGTAVRVVNGSLDARNSTFFANSRYGIDFAGLAGRNLLLRNSVLAANTVGGCIVAGLQSPGIATDGYNLTQGAGCELTAGPTNLVNSGAVLSGLVVSPDALTAWHEPLPGSPLRDAGHPDISVLGCTASDQRGSPRPLDGDGNGIARCDIGAIEAAAVGDALFANGFE